MNANEVLANLAGELLGTSGAATDSSTQRPREPQPVHERRLPDRLPSGDHPPVAAARGRAEDLAASFARQGARIGRRPRIARTCLRTPSTAHSPIFQRLCGIRRPLPPADRRSRGPPARREPRRHDHRPLLRRAATVPAAIVGALREATGDRRFTRARNLYDAAQNPDDMLAVSAALDILARGLVKIAADFRLLSSGPRPASARSDFPPFSPALP